MRLPWTASLSRSAARRAKAAGDWPRAARHYRQAVVRDPCSAPTWVQYGNALRECGKAPEAEAAYRKSLELSDNDPDAYVQLAHLLKQLHRGDEAIAEYSRALNLNPRLLHASRELIDLGWTSHVKPRASLQWNAAGSHRRSGHTLVIDAGDLLLYYLHARLPTGIQRVQLQIILALLNAPARNCELLVACFTPFRDSWVTVPEALFVRLAGLAAIGGAVDEPQWQEAVMDLTGVLVHGEPVEFPSGATLLNLGTTWPYPNYFLRLRDAKIRSSIRFIPFVHDCVPVARPEFCVEATVREYVDWLLGIFFHADRYLVNSQATALDLSRFAALLGHNIPPPEIVRLDGEFLGPQAAEQSPSLPFSREGQMGSATNRGIGPPEIDRLGHFVLLVASFEPRKNHLLAFEAWLKLTEKRGLRRTPLLVCVGHRSWKAEAAMSLLRSSKALRRRVRILTSIADGELAELYRRCLFTFYPSVYEGWGLPVTESLCHGKVPLIPAVSSLPEAGGIFAEYFDLNSADAVQKLERLIDLTDYRAGREAQIAEKFRARSWSEIARQVVDYALAEPPTCGEHSPPPAETGRYYAIARGRETGIRAGMVAGEMYRTGEGWWAPEDWGCWLKAGSADLVFSASSSCFLYVGLRGLPGRQVDFELTALEGGSCCRGTIASDQIQWPMLMVTPEEKKSSIRVKITSNQSCNLANFSGGLDRRVVTLGVVGFYLGSDGALTAPPLIPSPA